MKRRWALRFTLFVGAAMAAVALVLRTSWAGEQVCATARGVLSQVLDAQVQIDRCTIEPIGSELVIEGIRVGPPERPLFSARRMLVALEPLAFGRQFAIDRLELDDPVLDLALAGGDSADDEAGAGGDCLGVLRSVRLDELRIRDARFSIRLPDGALATVESLGLEVELRRRAYEARVSLADAAFLSGDVRIPVDAVDAAVRLAADGERLDVDRLQIAGAGIDASIHGSLEALCDPRAALQATIDVEAASAAAHFAPALENVRGKVRIQAAVRGEARAPEVEAEATIRGLAFDDFDLGDMQLHAALSGRTLTLHELLWPVGSGRAIVRGELELAGEFPARASVTTERLRFEELLAKLPIKNTPVQMAIDSEHQLAGRLGGGLLLEGDSRVRIDGFHVDDAPWHDPSGSRIVEIGSTATLDTHFRLTESGITLDPARASFGPGTTLHIAARLGFTEAEGMSIRVRAPHFDIDHLRSHVADVPLSGAGEIAATIEGPYANPLIEGDVDLKDGRLYAARLGHVRAHVRSLPSEGVVEFVDATGQEGATTWDADATLVFGGAPTIDVTASLRPGGTLGDLFGATAELVAPLAWMRDHLGGRIVSAEARARGALPNLQAEGSIVAQDVRFLDRPFDSLSAKLRVPGIDRLILEEVQLARGGGIARGTGTVHFPAGATASVDTTIDAHGLPIRDLLGAFGEWADLRGDVGARGHVRGPIDRLDVGGELWAEEVSASGVELRASRLSLETQGDQVIVRGPVAGAGTLSGAVRLADGLPFEATLQLDVPRLSRLMPEGVRVRGAITGTATAVGTLADVAASRGTVELDRLALRMADYRLESADRILLRFDGPSFELPGLRLQGENTELFLAGTRTTAGALDLQAQGRLDARILDSLLPQIEHATGVVEIKAAITGTGERPVLVGSANVERGAFRVKALPIQVQRLKADLTFSQNQVLVENATLLVNQGKARLRGAVSLRSWAPDRFDLTLDGERVAWRAPADWPAVVSGRLHFGGSWPRDLLLSGEVVVDRLRYARDLDLERMILDFREQVRRPPGPDEEEWLRLDVDLVGGADMRVDNNLLRARLQFVAPPGTERGRLKLLGTNVRLGLLGSVEVLDGIAFFRGNEFRVTHGVVEFDDRSAIDPHFDFTADTSIREYRVAVRAWGRLRDEGMDGFQLEMASEPTLAQADILSLLTFGITSRDMDRGSNPYTGAGVAAEALLTASGLDEHVKRWLPDTELILDPEISVTSQYVESTGQVEPMATFEAKVLSERLRLQAAAPFSTARGRRVSTEYRLNEQLSGQMVWEDEETGYSLGDLGVDIKLRWEWE